MTTPRLRKPRRPQISKHPRVSRRQITRGSARPARHVVNAHMQIFDLAKTGSSVTFMITAGDEKLGELEVGQGSVIWRGKNQRKGKRIRWPKFAKHLEEL